MINTQAYTRIFQAAHHLLNQNAAALGQDFIQRFLVDHDPRGSSSMVSTFYNFVVQMAQRLNNGQAEVKSDDQLFGIVGDYISQIFQRYQQQRMMAQPYNNGFGSPMGQPMMSPYGQNVSLNTSVPAGGVHLVDDTIGANKPMVMPPVQQASVPVAATTSSPHTPTGSPAMYQDNPLDSLIDQNPEWHGVPTKASWGVEQAKDNHIIIAHTEDLKSKDTPLTVKSLIGYHQVIQNDPLEVVKDFFQIAPDSFLSNNFIFKIHYHHLDIIDVPTNDFIQLREKCLESHSKDPQGFLHKKVLEAMDSMPRGPYKAMAGYLVHHINRALYLNCRLATSLKASLKINDVEDLDELLSSNFKSSFTSLQEGRYLLERVVGSAIWNALLLNTDVLFQEDHIPIHALQISPAFPFSIKYVYPNKFSIPTSSEEQAEYFLENLRKEELSKKSYLLSRRTVILTNILGKHQLPKIGNKPHFFQDTISRFFSNFEIPFTKLDPLRAAEIITPVKPYVSDDYPSDQLTGYYSNREEFDAEEQRRFANIRQNNLPVDQAIFAFQYGMSPKEYLLSFDVLSTFDKSPEGHVLLMKNNRKTYSLV